MSVQIPFPLPFLRSTPLGSCDGRFAAVAVAATTAAAAVPAAAVAAAAAAVVIVATSWGTAVRPAVSPVSSVNQLQPDPARARILTVAVNSLKRAQNRLTDEPWPDTLFLFFLHFFF